MDAKRFPSKRGPQRIFNKNKSRSDQSHRSSELRPYTVVFELDRPEQAKGVKATYTTDPLEGEAWLRNNVIDTNETVLGFDMEWKPQFIKKKLGGKENMTAVLQLSTTTSCLVLHIIHVTTFPRYLANVLTNQGILKVGCGIRADTIKLLKDTGLQCKGAVDLVQLAGKIGCSAQHGLGLKALSSNLLGLEMDKPKRVQLSNWEQCPLQRSQIHYAALDAWVGIKLYLHMKQSLSDEVDIQAQLLPVPQLPDDKKLICNVCGKKCKEEEKLQEHLANAGHTACTTCGELFVSQVTKRHLRQCSVSAQLHVQ